MAFISISEIFLDGGFANSIIQAPSITQRALNTIFLINIVLGGVLTAAFYFGAEKVGAFYGNQEIVPLTRVLSFMFLLWSLSSVQTSLLRKGMRFKELSTILIVGLVAGGTVSISLVLWGAGVWGLVSQLFVTNIVRLFLMWKYSEWRPTFVFSFSEVWQHAHIGIYMFLHGLVRRTFAQFHTFVLGPAFDSAMVGQFNRARSLLTLTHRFSTKPIANVYFPYVSKNQDKPDLVIARSILAFRYFGIFLSAAGVLLFLNAEFLLPVVFGPQWSPAIPLLKILVFSLHVEPVGAITAAILAGTGMGGKLLAQETAKKVLFISLQLYGLWYAGLNGFLIALVVGGNLTLLFDVWVLTSSFRVSWAALFKEIYGWPVLAIILAGMAKQLSMYLASGNHFVSSGIFLIAYGGLVFPTVRNFKASLKGKA